jgi:hypothetical protein
MKKYTLMLLVSPFLLTACGEGWEMVRSDKWFPYGNQRTAGTGVAYVLARMAPQKEMVLRPVERAMEPKAMERVFQEKQIK